jgi:hypothetical protein
MPYRSRRASGSAESVRRARVRHAPGPSTLTSVPPPRPTQSSASEC